MRLSRAVAGVAVALALLSAAPPARAQRLPTEARHGMVASASVLASRAGLEVLQQGGNAADAAVATGLALAVTYPRAGNIGGGGFLLLYRADGTATALDFREKAPAGATHDLYLDGQGRAIPGRSTVGHLAAGVPGTVAGLALALERYGSGKFTWAQLLEPARRYAAEGFAVTPALARDLRAAEKLLGQFPESRRIFLRDGRPYAAGEVFRQPELAATLQRLQEQGPQDFYSGETARLIAGENAAHGGLITAADLAAYRAVERTPLRGSYRGFEVITMPPPSSGGVTLLQILGMLEPFDISALGLNSAAKIHLFTEVMRRAFRDRGQFVGDPDFVRAPLAGLLDRKYLAGRMADFSPDHATPSATLGPGAPTIVAESTETTHFSVLDASGNAVVVTYTLNGLFGNGVTVSGAGFLLNNEMDDFATEVGGSNMYGLIQGEANAVAPGKRPLSSMTPTIVVRDRKAFLLTGSPGGPTIISTVALVITNIVDHGLSVTQAVDAPRFHHQWQPDVISHEPFLTSADTIALLQARGHQLSLRKLYPNAPEASGRSWGDAETILVDPQTGLLRGANDLRSPDSAALGW